MMEYTDIRPGTIAMDVSQTGKHAANHPDADESDAAKEVNPWNQSGYLLQQKPKALS
jgi:hypothetical protein